VSKRYTVSDGEFILFLWPAVEGGYNVTSHLNPALITQAETIEEAFEMARDALDLLTSHTLEYKECHKP
jgi:antitoxin HicB